MQPASESYKATAGDDWDHVLRFRVTGGTPLDVSDWTFTGQLRSDYGAEAATDIAFDVADADTGLVIMSLTAEQTRELADPALKKVWHYDVQRTLGGKTRTFLKGKFTIEPDITDD